MRDTRQVKRRADAKRSESVQPASDGAVGAGPSEPWRLPGLDPPLDAQAKRASLLAELDATLERLLPRAAAEAWPIRLDHCLLRVAYDNALGARWDALCRRPARAHLPAEALERAVEILRRMESGGRATVATLNARSLAFRRARTRWTDRARGG